MQSSLREPWDKLGNYGDNCKDRDDKCAKSASSDDGVACRQVTISLTLGRTGWKAEVMEVTGESALVENNTVDPFIKLQKKYGFTQIREFFV